MSETHEHVERPPADAADGPHASIKARVPDGCQDVSGSERLAV